eukprot:COSAG02_NODE_5533_length_4250_cov_2.274633_4_plen_281_part_00
MSADLLADRQPALHAEASTAAAAAAAARAARGVTEQSAKATTVEPARKRQKHQKPRGNLAHMCSDFVRNGSCRFGDGCRFAHSQSELKPSMRSAEVPAAREQLKQRLAERQITAANTAQDQRTMQDLPSFVTRYCREMFWVSPIDPVCAPLFQNHLALAAHGPIAVPEADRRTCTDEDQYVNMHKNELCIIGVAKTHSMFAANRTVTDVCYKLDCSEVTGKKKKGAMKCEQSSVLAVVTCNDGTEWAVKAVVPSKLIEINPRVVEDPSLLQVQPFPMLFC